MRRTDRDNFIEASISEDTGSLAENGGRSARTGISGCSRRFVLGRPVRRAVLRRAALALALIMLTPMLSGCGKRSRQEKELREFAIALMNEGAYGAAIAKFDEALSMNDGSVGEIEIDILKYRAQAEMLMGDYAAAEYTYTLLEREDGKSDEYTNLRIICMARAGSDLSRAMELYEKAEKEDPYGTGHEEALCVLGEVLSESELDSQRAKAKEFYETALADEKRRSGDLYDRLGMMLFKEGDIDGALQQLEEGMELIDSDARYADEDARKSIMYNIAVCREYQAKWEEALEAFREYESTFGSTSESSHEIAFIEGILWERN